MPISQDTEVSFLVELCQCTEGDPSVQKSMFDIGAAIGLPKEESGKVAEEIIGRGWAEVKTLSGGIAITAEGVEEARQNGAAPTAAAGTKIGNGPVLDEQDRQTVEQLINDARFAISNAKTDFNQIEEMVIDLKTLEVQLLSPRPKTAVIKAVLSGMGSTLATAGIDEIAQRIEQMIG